MCACKTGKMDATEWLLDEAKANANASTAEVRHHSISVEALPFGLSHRCFEHKKNNVVLI